MKALCFCPDICPSKASLRSLFRTSFTQDFQKMKSCDLYKLCWLMRIILQLLGYIRGRILFFFSHGLEPASSSSIARWLKQGLECAGVDTSIFKGHSTRGASSSKATSSGVTVSDILQAADWSSAGTFQCFYHRQSSNRSAFGKTVLIGKASNLNVDIETEPLEM